MYKTGVLLKRVNGKKETFVDPIFQWRGNEIGDTYSFTIDVSDKKGKVVQIAVVSELDSLKDLATQIIETEEVEKWIKKKHVKR